MILFFGELEPEAGIKLFDVVFNLLIECFGCIAIDFSEVSIKHNFYTSNGVDCILNKVDGFCFGRARFVAICDNLDDVRVFLFLRGHNLMNLNYAAKMQTMSRLSR